MSVVLRGATSNLEAVTRAGLNSDVGLIVSPEATKVRAGFQTQLCEVDPGAVTGSRLLREPDVSFDFRQRVGVDTVLWQDTFAYATISASRYQVITTTMTITQAGGLLNLNAGSATASGNVVNLRTYRTFPLLSSAPTYLYFSAIGINQAALNAQADVGLGFATTTVAPTDGVFFRWTLDGTLVGVQNNNGVEAVTAPLTQVADNERGEYLIVLNDESVEFWIDGVLRATLPAVTTQTGHGTVQSAALPFHARLFNNGTASVAKRLGIGEISVTQGDLNMHRPWAVQMAGQEQGAYQIPQGATAAQSATWTNSAAPASITLANNGAGANTLATLGGLFQFAAPAGAETDYVIFSYLVPAGSVSQPGLNLSVREIMIETVNLGAAVATTPTTLFWALGIGGTAADLATADSLTAGTRAYRRIPIGVQSYVVGAVIGAQAPRITFSCDGPLLVAAGTRINGIVRVPVGTATASQIIRGMITINGIWE